MNHFIDGHQVVTEADFDELALGTPPELWLGVPGESRAERAARRAAARDILADDPKLAQRVKALKRAAAALEEHRARLAKVIPLTTRRCAARKAVA